MKTQDIVCPVCRRTVRGYQPAKFPAEVEQGYTYIAPFGHRIVAGGPPLAPPCSGSHRPYYVGDGNL